MAWVNPLDKVPQVPVDWANHIVQGGAATCVLAGLMIASGKLSVVHSVDVAAVLMLALSVVKKAADFFKEHEGIGVCVGKALVTVVWPASLVAAVHLAKGG